MRKFRQTARYNKLTIDTRVRKTLMCRITSTASDNKPHIGTSIQGGYASRKVWKHSIYACKV